MVDVISLDKMNLDDSFEDLLSKMITKLANFTNLKSLRVNEPRVLCCDIVTLVKHTLPKIGRNLEYLKFSMPKKLDLRIIDFKHIVETFSNTKLFPCLKIIRMEQYEIYNH
jgi:hypothetical protein